MSSELRFVKWVRFFERNCIVKWVIFFASFCWLWDFLLENLKLRIKSDDIQWNVWANTKSLYARNNIFKKRIPNMRFLNHLYFGPNFHFWGTALGRFSSLVNLGGRHVCLAPLLPPPPPLHRHHKKASYGPVRLYL